MAQTPFGLHLGATAAARNWHEMSFFAEAAGENVTVEGALHAWIDTDLDVQIEDPDNWVSFGKIAAQANSAAGWGAEKMTSYFDPVVIALVDLLKKAMPKCDEERIPFGRRNLRA